MVRKGVVDDEEVNLNVIADDMVYSCRSFFVVLHQYRISTTRMFIIENWE